MSFESAESAHTDLVATLGDLAQLEMLDQLPRGAASWLEVRADLLGDVDVATLRDRFPGELLYTLRSRAEGGAGENDPALRRSRLERAAEHYDLVDFEIDRDVDAAHAVPVSRRLLSWHDDPGSSTSSV